ncbi:peptide chain release factor N(5)-glutamine methyltransferase [Curvibacter sp. RS43]|uniref:peptide chain release factor N(5)-glutamine methyltransferase n=1 Tax=Curvibacter microcysteis TaxID=3026419 RepID=UPI00235EFF40|nr:peptide chain release factor N(5)-glutamine methyltransferase [Curvibacter sp. RS43]MDD0810394.1 peptide chain release factor N(5)-glutamine methyltransferase [Curvibacter sp. RS43]
MSSASTVQQALAQGQAAGLPRLEAQMLLLLALQRAPHDRAWLLAHDSDPLSPAAQARLAKLQQRRLDGEPMAYLSGEHEFYGLTLRVDARVLDPRPDTETLVDWALAQLPQHAGLRAADLGTGSGAIALAIAQQRPDVQVSAVDASADALAVAQANGERLRLPVTWHLGDWFSPLAGQRFELLVSNPPYIAEADPHMAALRHEPRRALTSGADGLDDLKRLVQDAPEHLQTGGWLLLEHGWDQAEAVRALLSARGFSSVQSRVDLAGIERCSGGQWPGLR